MTAVGPSVQSWKVRQAFGTHDCEQSPTLKGLEGHLPILPHPALPPTEGAHYVTKQLMSLLDCPSC